MGQFLSRNPIVNRRPHTTTDEDNNADIEMAPPSNPPVESTVSRMRYHRDHFFRRHLRLIMGCWVVIGFLLFFICGMILGHYKANRDGAECFGDEDWNSFSVSFGQEKRTIPEGGWMMSRRWRIRTGIACWQWNGVEWINCPPFLFLLLCYCLFVRPFLLVSCIIQCLSSHCFFKRHRLIFT